MGFETFSLKNENWKNVCLLPHLLWENISYWIAVIEVYFKTLHDQRKEILKDKQGNSGQMNVIETGKRIHYKSVSVMEDLRRVGLGVWNVKFYTIHMFATSRYSAPQNFKSYFLHKWSKVILK